MSTSSRVRQWQICLNLIQTTSATQTQQKDVLEQLCTDYFAGVQKHPFPAEEEGEEKKEVSSAQANDVAAESLSSEALDPLTAMMMEEQSKQEHLDKMDLQYRKERAKRNRGNATPRVIESEEYNEQAVTLQIIDKDLQRLPARHQSPPQRVELLRQVLFIYHCRTHPSPGYRQGQHEVASYLLLAIEEEHESVDWSQEGTIRDTMASNTFALLYTILDSIQAAYDSSKSGEKQPLVCLGRRILQVTAQYHPVLMKELQQKVQVPPQLYLTKWIRLLFSRELSTTSSKDSASNLNNTNDPKNDSLTAHVLSLWDFLFQAVSSTPGITLLNVLEAAATARLLVHSHVILKSEDPLHYLMNMPPQDPSSMVAWRAVTMEILQRKPPPLSHVSLSQPEPAHNPPTPSSSATDGSGFWNTSLSALTLTSSTNDPLSGSTNNHTTTTPDNNDRPLLSSLSAGLKQTLEQAKSKTQSISKRIYQEWEHAKQQQQQQTEFEQQQRQQQQRSSTSQATTRDSYNVGYRDNTTLYDPPVMVSSPTTSSNVNVNATNEWKQAFATNTMVLQSYLTWLDQEKNIDIPPHVWQAMGELHALGQSPGASPAGSS